MTAHPLTPPAASPAVDSDDAYRPASEDLVLLAEIGFVACLHDMADQVEPIFHALDLWRADHAVAAIGRGLAAMAQNRPDDAVRALDDSILRGKKAADNGRVLRLQALYRADRLPEADLLRQQLMACTDGLIKDVATKLPEMMNLQRR